MEYCEKKIKNLCRHLCDFFLAEPTPCLLPVLVHCFNFCSSLPDLLINQESLPLNTAVGADLLSRSSCCGCGSSNSYFRSFSLSLTPYMFQLLQPAGVSYQLLGWHIPRLTHNPSTLLYYTFAVLISCSELTAFDQSKQCNEFVKSFHTNMINTVHPNTIPSIPTQSTLAPWCYNHP